MVSCQTSSTQGLTGLVPSLPALSCVLSPLPYYALPGYSSERMIIQIAEYIPISRTRSHRSRGRWLVSEKLELVYLHVQSQTRHTISIGVLTRNQLPLDIDLLALLHIRVDRLRLLAECDTVEPRGRFFVLRFPCHRDRKLRDGCPIRGITHLWVTPQIADKGQLCHAHCQFLLQYDTDSFFFWTSRSVAQQTYARFPLYSPGHFSSRCLSRASGLCTRGNHILH